MCVTLISTGLSNDGCEGDGEGGECLIFLSLIVGVSDKLDDKCLFSIFVLIVGAIVNVGLVEG